MHIHNAPMQDDDHAKTAVQTGINMLRAVEKFNNEITKQGRPPIGMGAGINSGLGYVGEMGSTSRHSYDILGDAVSTAARIESKCKEYGCLLLVGEETVKRCNPEEFFFLKVDDLAVKGKSVGIGIYTVLDLNKDKYIKYGTIYGKKYCVKTDYGDWDNDFTMEILEKFISEYYNKLKKGGTLIIFFDLWKISPGWSPLPWTHDGPSQRSIRTKDLHAIPLISVPQKKA